jgi:hypothetical protein
MLQTDNELGLSTVSRCVLLSLLLSHTDLNRHPDWPLGLVLRFCLPTIKPLFPTTSCFFLLQRADTCWAETSQEDEQQFEK